MLPPQRQDESRGVIAIAQVQFVSERNKRNGSAQGWPGNPGAMLVARAPSAEPAALPAPEAQPIGARIMVASRCS